MESQLVSGLRAELDASRRENEHICTQVQALCMEFGLYRKATQVKLSELRQHKRMLEGKVRGLQKKLGASDGNEKKKTSAAQAETENGRHPNTSDGDAMPCLKGIEEQTRAQERQAHGINFQWESPLLDREIAAAVDSYASEVAASVNGYDGGSMTPSAAATAPIDSNHPHQYVKDEQAGDSQQRLPDNSNNINNTNQGPFLGPFYPAPLPFALDGQSGERQGSHKRSRPRRKTESGKFSSKDAKALRKRTLLPRRVTHSGAPDGTSTYSEGSSP